MRALAQYPIESGRRDFQRVIALDRILDLEHFAHRVTHCRTIIDGHARIRPVRTVNEYPQHAAASRLRELEVEQLKAQGLDRRLQQAHQGVTHLPTLANLGSRIASPATWPKTKKGTIG